MTTNSLESLEERIKKPGYLLLLVVIWLLLVIGLVDLLDYIAESPVVLGRYTLRYFFLLVTYSLFFLAWSALLFRPNDDRLVRGALDYIQMHPVLAISALVAIGIAVLYMINSGKTIEGAIITLQAFQLVVLTITLLFSGIIVFYKWGEEDRPQTWRKILLVILGFLMVIELIMQVLAYFGAFPRDLNTTQSFDAYSPYNRIYQTEEGFGNGLTNNFGRYAQEFDLLPDTTRIAILGDSFVEGLQVKKKQNFGALVEQQLNDDVDGEQVSEVLPIGHPDLGPGVYLSEWLMDAMIRDLDPDEAIIFFDMGNDFQIVDSAGQGYPYFEYEGEGKATLDETYHYRDFHEAEHHIYRGYKGFQPVLILRSNYLTRRLFWETLLEYFEGESKSRALEPVPGTYNIDLPNGFVFSDETNEKALGIAVAQINMAKQHLNESGIDVKLVVNPVFTDAFYEQSGWSTSFGNADLLRPEHHLQAAAEQYGIPFLGLGTYMESLDLTPSQVRELYFNEGRGRYTPKGHQFAATAIYQCFYAQTLTLEEGCVLPN